MLARGKSDVWVPLLRPQQDTEKLGQPHTNGLKWDYLVRAPVQSGLPAQPFPRRPRGRGRGPSSTPISGRKEALPQVGSFQPLQAAGLPPLPAQPLPGPEIPPGQQISWWQRGRGGGGWGWASREQSAGSRDSRGPGRRVTGRAPVRTSWAGAGEATHQRRRKPHKWPGHPEEIEGFSRKRN